jgi:ribonucleoside-diphosphate reductase beta chain
MIEQAVQCATEFAADLLPGGVAGLARRETRVADQCLIMRDVPVRHATQNPFGIMELQDVQELVNLFGRQVSACQVSVRRAICFDAAF